MIKTGGFVEHRDHRAYLREMATGTRTEDDVFDYSCGVSVTEEGGPNQSGELSVYLVDCEYQSHRN
eukprot:6427043-Pyramimonas_sp.AAC.1